MRSTIRFLRKGKAVELSDVKPTDTVLDYLRLKERACGTKEGCAEGDCGACTIAVGMLTNGGLRYRPVNSCIQLLGQVDGHEIIAVDDLASAEGGLHPVQQAMVHHHASQCGFCTPGFVMSLFSLYHAGYRPDRLDVNDWLAGNLCRCTGYRPIVDAARRMYELGADDQFSAREAETIEQLKALGRADRLAFAQDGKRYFAPRRIDDLAALCAQFPDASLLAGGTDVGLWVT
jgi:xanthine dehydrogenase small subunit